MFTAEGLMILSLTLSPFFVIKGGDASNTFPFMVYASYTGSWRGAPAPRGSALHWG